jgi:hypothetical protein
MLVKHHNMRPVFDEDQSVRNEVKQNEHCSREEYHAAHV